MTPPALFRQYVALGLTPTEALGVLADAGRQRHVMRSAVDDDDVWLMRVRRASALGSFVTVGSALGGGRGAG